MMLGRNAPMRRHLSGLCVRLRDAANSAKWPATHFHGGNTDSELAVAQRFSRWLPSHPRGLTVWPLHVPLIVRSSFGFACSCSASSAVLPGPRSTLQIASYRFSRASDSNRLVSTQGFTPGPAQRFTPRASCTETVSKAVRFGPLDLCLSERQIPQVIVFIRRDRNQWRL